MKNITKSLFGLIFLALGINAYAQDCSGFYYITSNAGWTQSEYYKIIDIDAATLTDPALPKFTASEGNLNALNTDFGSGNFKTPVLTTADGVVYTPTSVMWPINYKLCAFAPTMHTSAWAKVNVVGSNPSGTGTYVACTLNDNSVKTSNIFAKPGFIELSRQPSAVLNTPPSLHGIIEIDSLPQVERIQWSYSATSWKRGVKCDINYNDGKGWQPQRWVASDYSSWEATFSEQGYQFEEMIGKQDDPTSFVSIRFRIWDGDSIHYKVNANDLSLQTTTYGPITPLAQKQTVRIHQIKVFSNIIPTSAPNAVDLLVSGVKNIQQSNMRIYLSGSEIILSEKAKAELYSIDGKKVYNGTTDIINVSTLSKGIYIIRAIDSEGKIQNKKIAI